mmetsp:Transcript_17512/g.32436  ORF Transcript_17512/g.32436 Transcript_17512/m.32436 type:complete len:251 (-) Transcript_17512:177-929(-)
MGCFQAKLKQSDFQEPFGTIAKQKVDAALRELTQQYGILHIISSPHKKCVGINTCIQEEHMSKGEWLFNPDKDFPTFGVIASENSAGWVYCWGAILKEVAKAKGTAYFLKHIRRGLEGSQQEGECGMCHDVQQKPILRIVFVYYDDDGKEIKRVSGEEEREAAREKMEEEEKQKAIEVLREELSKSIGGRAEADERFWTAKAKKEEEDHEVLRERLSKSIGGRAEADERFRAARAKKEEEEDQHWQQDRM